MTTLGGKRQAVIDSLRRSIPPQRGGRLAIAFSGGVDSTLLLALALEALPPEQVVAITARSESLPAAELEGCRRIAAGLGAALIEVRTEELARGGYRDNAGDRCYHCKTELFERIDDEVREAQDVAAVAYGATVDDLGDHRPGMRAAREHAVLAPLAEAGLTKAEIRELSRELGLETWDKPAHPCLASRIPYGQRVSAEKLSRIEGAEVVLRELGLDELRVRHHDQVGSHAPLARIEVPLAELPRLLEVGVRERVVRELRALGFQYVVLDLEGFRSGGLNDLLAAAPRKLPLTS